MKIIFDRSTLIETVGLAMSSVSTKNTIAAIECIQFVTEGDNACTLSSYDLEKGFRSTIECEVKEGGSWLINAQKLSRMIKTMPDDTITIQVNEKGNVKVSSGKSEFSLSAILGSEFPALPDLTGEQGYNLPQRVLRRIISQVSHAIGSNEQRPELGGAKFELNQDILKIIACDGNRFALREHSVENTHGLVHSFIVPGRTLSELLKIMKNDDDAVEVIFVRRHVVFNLGEGGMFFSRLIEGEHIDYKAVIPQNSSISVTIDRAEFYESLERAALVTEDRSLGAATAPVRCEFTDGLLVVKSSSSASSVYDEVSIEKDGDDLVIGFNCRYLLDALRAADCEKVQLSMTTALMSLLITGIESDSESESDEKEKIDESSVHDEFLFVVMPVRLKD